MPIKTMCELLKKQSNDYEKINKDLKKLNVWDRRHFLDKGATGILKKNTE